MITRVLILCCIILLAAYPCWCQIASHASSTVTDAPVSSSISAVWISDLHLDLHYDGQFGSKYMCRHAGFVKRNDLRLPPRMGPKPNIVSVRTPSTDFTGVAVSGNTMAPITCVSPYYCPEGQYGCDSPMGLFNSLLDAITTVPQPMQSSESPDVILLTGDVAAHQLSSRQDILHTMSIVFSKFTLKFPSSRIIASIGNNGFYTHFNGVCNDSMFMELLHLWQPLVPNDISQTFLLGGYYATDLTYSTSVLVMNPVFYSVENPNISVLRLQEDPCSQFAWLRRGLNNARQQQRKVIIVGHQPPGAGRATTELDLGWLDMFASTFRNLLSEFQDVLSATLFGHFHRQAVRILRDPNAYGNLAPIIVSGSVSPILLNNPMFQRLIINKDSGIVQDMWSYNMKGYTSTGKSLGWSLMYKWTEFFGVSDMCPMNVLDSALRLLRDDALFTMFFKYHNGLYPEPVVIKLSPKSLCHLGVWDGCTMRCALRYLLFKEFSECINGAVGQEFNLRKFVEPEIQDSDG